MKYIRTKDEVMLTEDYLNHPLFKALEKSAGVTPEKFLQGTTQADTIEELCDEFILEEKMREVIYHHKSTKFDDFKTIAMLNERYTLYGAIWASKGLIYVAKMNDKGELELI